MTLPYHTAHTKRAVKSEAKAARRGDSSKVSPKRQSSHTGNSQAAKAEQKKETKVVIA